MSQSFGNALLPEAARRRLDALQLVPNRIRAGAFKGERRSLRRGTSVEFADYRNYSPGDDLRRLDWNIYARLERPYIKLLEDEEDLAVHILLDISGSMGWQPEDASSETHKLLYAQRLAAALAYIALGSGDRLMMAAFSDAGAIWHGPARGRGQTVAMLRYLRDLRAEGVTDLNAALRDYALRERRPGLCIILSDFFAPGGHSEGLNALLAKGHEVALLQILAPEEITPPLAGDLRLVDVETGQPQEVSVDAAMRDLYEQRLQGWLDSIRDDCARKGAHYLLLPTNTPWEKAILVEMRRLGMVK